MSAHLPAAGSAYGWGAPPGRPAAPGIGVDARPRWAGTIAVAVIVAGVVLGGIAADNAIPVPSAGRVAISQPVYMTAAPGWVTTTAVGEITDGLALQNSSALLIAQVLSTNYDRDARQLLQASEASFGADAAQISFGGERDVVLNGKDASEVTFSALVSGDGGSGMLDGELVCLVLPSDGSGYAVFIQVAAPQGDLSSITDDVDAMAGSVELSQ
ncbi:MAG TPA: hypothetical protein VJ258_02940 [Candidatus Limnocylindrales bacterium]|jgi:hypothetical protein|nr:hypothetical protein [Candidatus Limnocylindrales bacterium]